MVGERIKTKKKKKQINRDFSLYHPQCSSHPPHPQVLSTVAMVREDSSSQGTCLAIAAVRCSQLQDLVCLGAMAGERIKPRAFLPLSLSYYPPPCRPPPHKHPYTVLLPKREDSSLSFFCSCLVYISGNWAAFDPGSGRLRGKKKKQRSN